MTSTEMDFSTLSRSQKLALYDSMLQEEKQRRTTVGKISPWINYAKDPVGFIQTGLKEHIWSKQREIAQALVEHDRVAVKSCHQVGKSYIAARMVGWFIATHPPGEAFVVTSAPTFPQVRAILWREINRVHAKGRLIGRCNQTEWIIGSELVAFGRKPEDASPAAFQGLHALNFLVVFDEACGMPPPLWTAAETLIANEGGKFLAIGNPDDPNTEFGEICKPGSGWHVITISAFDSPNFTGEAVPSDVSKRLISKTWAEQRAKRWGESSPLYQSKVKGEFPDVSEDSLIAPRYVTAAVLRELEAEGPNELGVDVARYGRNESVIYHRIGPVARLHDTCRQRDLMVLCGLVVKAVIETGAKAVKIDDIGMGGGVTDRLQEIAREGIVSDQGERSFPLRGVRIVPVNVGIAATERIVERIGSREITAKQRFANLKAEVTWALRDRFVEGTIDLGEDEDTQAQATSVRYSINSRGLLAIEGKEDLEKRLGKMEGITGDSGSPDRFDALVLAYADVGGNIPLVITQDVLARSRMPGGAPIPSAAPKITPPSGIFVSQAVLGRSRERR